MVGLDGDGDEIKAQVATMVTMVMRDGSRWYCVLTAYWP